MSSGWLQGSLCVGHEGAVDLLDELPLEGAQGSARLLPVARCRA